MGDSSIQGQVSPPGRSRRLARRVAIGLVALLSPSIGLLLAGVPARWAALPFLLPLAAVPGYWVLPDHPDALAVIALVGGAAAVLFTLVCSAVAFWYAGRETRTRRTKAALLGILGLFLAASVASQALLAQLREKRLEPFRIPSAAMVPTLIPGDQFFVDKRKLSHPGPGDVVVFRPPGDHQEPHVKRVVAVEGDTFEIRGDQVWVNGRELAHVPLPSGETCSTATRESARGRCIRETLRPGRTYQLLLVDRVPEHFGPLKLQPGELFVLGDNRNNSYDSRHYGPIREDRVVGRALVVWWSWWEWRPRLSRIGLKP